VQLVAPSPKPGRLVVCSSAYWTGGEMKGGNIIKPVRKTPFFEPFMYKNEHFTKTGSGQT